MRLTKRSVLVMTLALSVILMALPVSAKRADVTRGGFETFASGVGRYDDVDGRALMVRTPRSTIVLVVVSGLNPGETYGSHVHNQACGTGDAGGHYSFGYPVPGGDHASGSEIWPGPFTANGAGRAVGVAWVGETAGPSAVSVVVHAPADHPEIPSGKIACADLS